MNRILEFLLKLMLLLILGPAVLALLFESAAAILKFLLPWLVLGFVIVAVITGISLTASLKRRFPLSPSRPSFSANGSARQNYVKRPRGPRGRSD